MMVSTMKNCLFSAGQLSKMEMKKLSIKQGNPDSLAWEWEREAPGPYF